MLDDRSYMQSSPFSSRRSVTVTLIIILIGIYFVQAAMMFYGRYDLFRWLGLSVEGVANGRIWQILTFQFLHDAPWPFHLIFNCIGLYFFGRAVEDIVGPRGLLKLYFAAGFIGGGLQLLTTWILPGHADYPVVGASAGVMGLLAAFATLFPMREIVFFILFFPVSIRAQYFFWFCFLLSAYGTIVPFGTYAHAAHLGGLLVGVAFVRLDAVRNLSFRSAWPFKKRSPKRQLVRTASLRMGSWGQGKGREEEELPPEEFISREVDPILDKISAHGIQSLTPRERQILEAARNKMEKR